MECESTLDTMTRFAMRQDNHEDGGSKSSGKEELDGTRKSKELQLLGAFSVHDVLLNVAGGGGGAGDRVSQYEKLFPGNVAFREHLRSVSPLYDEGVDSIMYLNRSVTVIDDDDDDDDVYDNAGCSGARAAPLPHPVIRLILESVWAQGGRFLVLDHFSGHVLCASNATAISWIRKALRNLVRSENRTQNTVQERQSRQRRQQHRRRRRRSVKKEKASTTGSGDANNATTAKISTPPHASSKKAMTKTKHNKKKNSNMTTMTGRNKLFSQHTK